MGALSYYSPHMNFIKDAVILRIPTWQQEIIAIVGAHLLLALVIVVTRVGRTCKG